MKIGIHLAQVQAVQICLLRTHHTMSFGRLVHNLLRTSARMLHVDADPNL